LQTGHPEQGVCVQPSEHSGPSVMLANGLCEDSWKEFCGHKHLIHNHLILEINIVLGFFKNVKQRKVVL